MDDRLEARKLFIKHNFSRQSPHHKQSRRHETFAFSGLVCVCLCLSVLWICDRQTTGRTQPTQHWTRPGWRPRSNVVLTSQHFYIHTNIYTELFINGCMAAKEEKRSYSYICNVANGPRPVYTYYFYDYFYLYNSEWPPCIYQSQGPMAWRAHCSRRLCGYGYGYGSGSGLWVRPNGAQYKRKYKRGTKRASKSSKPII